MSWRRIGWVGETCRVFCSHDHLVPNTTLLHPLTNPFLGFFELVVVCTKYTSAQETTIEAARRPHSEIVSQHVRGKTSINLRVDKITALVMEQVQNLEYRLLVTFAHHVLLRIAKVHGSQAKRGDTDASSGRHDTVEIQQGGSLWLEAEWRSWFRHCSNKMTIAVECV